MNQPEQQHEFVNAVKVARLVQVYFHNVVDSGKMSVCVCVSRARITAFRVLQQAIKIAGDR